MGDSYSKDLDFDKLSACGFFGKLHSCVAKYLSGPYHLRSAPRGGIQGPIIFVIFINDIPDAAKGQVLRFMLAIQRFLVLVSVLATAKLYSHPIKYGRTDALLQHPI